MKIIWITGQSQSGKTTLAKQMMEGTENSILLDGDLLREVYPTGFSKKERWEHNLRVARLAKMFKELGHDVFVAVICPYKELRDEVQKITNCSFIYLSGGESGKDYPYEYETNKFYFKQ